MTLIYVNASYQDDSALGRLMHDMFCEDPDDMYYEELAERSRYFKNDEHRVRKMCKIMEDLIAEGREDLVNQARENEQENTILRLFRKGKKIADMMDATDWTAERIENFLRTQNLQPAQ